jgi:hypothetical protein
MRKATVTYVAPHGDNKVVETHGLTFFDGQSQELNTDDHEAFLKKVDGNQHFEVEWGEEEKSDKPRRGRPPNSLKDKMEAASADQPLAVLKKAEDEIVT